MQIFVDHKLAALKEGTSFEYVSENRLFSGSDGYSLTITFPLRDCESNINIFGHIHRADVKARDVVFDCEIRDKGLILSGSITITEISESEVKTQFLEGRSVKNFDKTFDKVYIDELTLGSKSTLLSSAISPTAAWTPDPQNPQWVALPWVNDYSGNIQNLVEYANGVYSWKSAYLSWQPYLIYLARLICAAVEYDADFEAWNNNVGCKYLLCCNCIPKTSAVNNEDYSRALPHWTVEEFFEKLELLLGGEFDFDHRSKRITFNFTEQILASKHNVIINDVLEEHSTEIDVEGNSTSSDSYSEVMNLEYKECDHETWKFYSCDWYVKKENAYCYNTLQELVNAQKNKAVMTMERGTFNAIYYYFYAADCDAFFCIYPLKDTFEEISQGEGRRPLQKANTVLRPLNMLGPRIVDSDENAKSEEIEFVPVRIERTEQKYGWCMFLPFQGNDDDDVASDSDVDKAKTGLELRLERGEKEKKSEIYDRIYIGYWDGALLGDGKLPHPWVENPIISDDWNQIYYKPNFSLRLNASANNMRPVNYPIDTTRKTTFKFLANAIPDVRSLFFIRGKRYVCEKLTATFTDRGMSQLIKGVFWPLREDDEF